MYIGTDVPLEVADTANYKPIGIEAHLFVSFGAERDCSVIWRHMVSPRCLKRQIRHLGQQTMRQR